jgi:hypothetical protein
MGSGSVDPHFHDLGTNWRRIVGFTPRPLYPQGKSPRYPLDRRLWGPRSDLDDVEKIKFLTVPELELRPLGCSVVASRYTDYAIPAAVSGYLSDQIRHNRPKVI